MMKTADARQGPRLAWFGRAWLNRPARRRRLLQADVRAVFLGKGRKMRAVPLMANTVQLLGSHTQETTLIIPNSSTSLFSTTRATSD